MLILAKQGCFDKTRSPPLRGPNVNVLAYHCPHFLGQRSQHGGGKVFALQQSLQLGLAVQVRLSGPASQVKPSLEMEVFGPAAQEGRGVWFVCKHQAQNADAKGDFGDWATLKSATAHLRELSSDSL